MKARDEILDIGINMRFCGGTRVRYRALFG
jgi:hypothetical protein